jgi:hypothetical protein
MTHVQVRVQHAEGRDEPLARLVGQLENLTPALDFEVITDSGPSNPWRGYQRCLSGLPDCSHLLLLQDDTIVCRNFSQAVLEIAEAKPHEPVCLFVPGAARHTVVEMSRAMKQRNPFARVKASGFVPVVAVLWPVAKAAEFLEWTRRHPKRLGNFDLRSDDAAAAKWCAHTGQTMWASVPSLVEHPDDVVSTIGKRASAGKDRGRVAAFYIGDADPLDVDWSRV